MTRLLRRDHGAATTVTVIIVPVVMGCVLLVVQFALAYHARHVASAAAADAAHAAAAFDAPPDTAASTANHILDANASRLLNHVTVAVTATAEEITVTVTGTVNNVIPGLSIDVTGSGRAPRERFVAGGQP